MVLQCLAPQSLSPWSMHASAISVDDSSVEVFVDHAVDSSATGERDLEGGILAVRASSPATAGDGNRSGLLELIEYVFHCLVTRFANSPDSSLSVSSHARARALCFAAASSILSDPHSALLALLALIDAHAFEFRCFLSRHVGISRGCMGHATAHVFLSLWRYGCGQTAPDSWAMGMPVLWHGWVLADAAKLLSVWCISFGSNCGQRPQRESHYPGQPGNQGLPINPTKRV